MGQGNTPVDDNGKPVLALWNDATGKAVPVHIGSTVTGSDGQTYAILDVNASVSPPASAVSTTNSSTTLLAANAVFTGTSESILPYGAISVQAYSDHASAASGLIVEQSQDGTNWDTQAASSVLAATAYQTTVNATGKFYRIVYTNGSTDQTVFRLQTIKEVAASPSAGVANQRVNTHSGDIASGSIASGAVASGAIASGAVAAGAIAAGAYVSGSVLSGAFADGAIATIGAKADAKSTATDTTAITMMQVLKEISFMAQTPAALPANQSSNVAQVAGNTAATDSGTSGNGTQRIINAGAATGTKSSVSSSGSSVTILASNTSRKGAMVYNDSTQILYLDLSGGTASSTSYSVQVGSQQHYELPGPTIYNGAITGIWASANGSARVTETT